MRGLVFKLLLKACVPLLLVVGTVSYGTYLRGGDPGAVIARVGDGLSARFAELGAGARDDIVRASNGVTGASTTVRRWTDADGTVHYSNAPDAPVDARIVQVDPRTNVIIAVRPPPPQPPSSAAALPASRPDTPGAGGAGAVPGVAGSLGAVPKDVTPEQAQALLRMLQDH